MAYSVFHDFDDAHDEAYWRDVMHQMLVSVANPQPLILADLTDEVLDSAGIDRGQVSSAPQGIAHAPDAWHASSTTHKLTETIQ